MIATRPIDQEAVEHELLALLARQGLKVVFPGAAVGVALAFMGFMARPGLWPVVWLLLVFALLGFRGWWLRYLQRRQDLPVDQRLRTIIVLSLANGLLFSSTVLFVVDFSPYLRTLHTMLLMGLCTGAVATSVGYGPVFLAFVVPITFTTGLSWITGVGVHPVGALDVVFGLFIVPFTWVLWASGREAYRLFCESWQMGQQQVQTNHRLTLSLNQAESAMRAKTRFLAAASHDLRQPMHTLSLFGAALDRRTMDDEARGIVRKMNLALEALATQMDALLDVSKLDAHVVPVKPQILRLDVWLQRLRTDWAAAAERKQLSFTLECPLSVFVESDPVLLERILRNLVDNAVKYTKSGGVSVVVEPGDGVWIVHVRDSGCGIPPEEQARVFEEFYQLNNPDRDRSQGLGLGLSIVARLVDLLDVSLALSSKPGGGSVFTLTLNAVEPTSSADLDANHSPEVQLRGLRVLVVDDEESIRQAIQTLLVAYGCEVLLARDARSAMLHVLKQHPDIALVDFRLRSGEDGIATIRSLRNTAPGLSAIVVSGDTAPERLLEAERAGLTFLHKPVSSQTLLRAIQQSLASR
jgi:signal transduction histidine kinase